MNHSKRTLCLLGNTIEEDLSIALKYQSCVDLYELRADYLAPSQCKLIPTLPSRLPHPAILTCRRSRDGGQFTDDDNARIPIFKSLTTFDYVDLEVDNQCKYVEDLISKAPHTRLIRSEHLFSSTPIFEIKKRLTHHPKSSLAFPPIQKLAFTPASLKDLSDLFSFVKSLPQNDRIICAMGPIGIPTRILSSLLGSFCTYTSPQEEGTRSKLGHIPPDRLADIFKVNSITPNTAIVGVTGWPLLITSSPEIHRTFYTENHLDATLIPIPTPSIQDALDFAKTMNLRGLAVTVPHKQTIIPLLDEISTEAKAIGAVNTVTIRDGKTTGYNTDAEGFSKALTQFLAIPTTHTTLRHYKIAIIGNGGAAAAVAYALSQLGALDVTIYGRNAPNAKALAEKYNFAASPIASLAQSSPPDIIIQCTPVGNGTTHDDPIPFYNFTGREKLFDLIYNPPRTALMARAEIAGAHTQNGLTMLKAQARLQHALFFQREE